MHESHYQVVFCQKTVRDPVFHLLSFSVLQRRLYSQDSRLIKQHAIFNLPPLSRIDTAHAPRDHISSIPQVDAHELGRTARLKHCRLRSMPIVARFAVPLIDIIISSGENNVNCVSGKLIFIRRPFFMSASHLCCTIEKSDRLPNMSRMIRGL